MNPAALPGPVLAPAGLYARLDAPLAWMLLMGGTLLFAGVMALAARAVAGRAQTVRPAWWLVGGGLVLPLIVLGPLAAVNLRHLAAAYDPPPAGALVMGVDAKAWWWALRVPHPEGGADIATANELVLPTGRPVRLALSSESLIHSLWVPALAGKMDLVPGRVNHLLLQAEQPGEWRGPCAEFCGTGHTRMVLHVRALPPADYEAWRLAQAAPARAPQTPRQQRGLQVYEEQRCGACHTVRGVNDSLLAPLGGDAGGPDLTHLASRAWLGAGALRNDAEGLRAWLTGVQRHKPHARMPEYGHLDEASLGALVDWLGHLR